jgi:hypothetical protein
MRGDANRTRRVGSNFVERGVPVRDGAHVMDAPRSARVTPSLMTESRPRKRIAATAYPKVNGSVFRLSLAVRGYAIGIPEHHLPGIGSVVRLMREGGDRIVGVMSDS